MSGEQKEVLTPGEVWRMLGMTKTTFYRFVKDNPEFPLPIVLGKRNVTKYLREEIEWYLRHRPRGEQPRKPDSGRS